MKLHTKTCTISLGGIEFPMSSVSYGSAVTERKPLDRVCGSYKRNFEFTVRLDPIDLWDFLYGVDQQIERWEGEGGAVICES